jgi:hypothetical protein
LFDLSCVVGSCGESRNKQHQNGGSEIFQKHQKNFVLLSKIYCTTNITVGGIDEMLASQLCYVKLREIVFVHKLFQAMFA